MDIRSREELVRALLSTHSTVLADIDRSPAATPRLLVRTDASGTFQLCELVDGTLNPLTDLPEPVSDGYYVPGTRRAVLEIDAGGDERGQLFELELDRAAPVTVLAQLRALSDDPRHGHHLAGISPDGSLLAYTSDRDGGVDFDVYLCDLETGEHRRLWASGGWARPASGFSPDGRYLSVLVPGARPLDMRLVLIDVTGEHGVSVTSSPGNPALFGSPAWLGTDDFLYSTDAESDLRAVDRRRAGSPAGRSRIADTGERYDTGVVSSLDGSAAIAVENRDGAGVMRVIDLAANALGPEIATPEAGMIDPILSPDGSTVYYSLSTPRIPGDVFASELRSGRIRRLTESAMEIPASELAVPELGSVESFDGETVPYFIYRPREPAGEPPPVVVFVHGGPEFQATRLHSPVVQALVAVGYAVVVPNVRGSTGYGRRYAGLDDTTRRLDAVRDLASVHASLAALGADPGRAALWGGSYGGYMVLAGLAFQPELWAAGIDIVGIASLVTFLERTSPYRRAHREREYGSLEDDRAFLTEASPLTHVDVMRAPLFVIHGRNDPRVPVTEAEQLVRSLRARDVRCELCIYEDEGHGLARLANRLDAFPRAIAFLDEALGRV